MSIVRDRFKRPGETASLGMHFPHAASMTTVKGEVFIEMVDAASGEVLHKDHRQNVITLDAGILAAILFRYPSQVIKKSIGPQDKGDFFAIRGNGNGFFSFKCNFFGPATIFGLRSFG